MMEYRTIAAPVSASFVEKKSEFIAQLFPARTQEEAVEAIEEVRKQHRRARHNVYAYLLRDGNASRYSDDGEPQGTSGAPIVQMLVKEGITNVAVVVTRYFGGIKLGTGGLVRAYTSSAKLALEAAGIADVREMLVLEVRMAYSYLAKMKNLAGEFFSVENISYTDSIVMQLSTEPENEERLKAFLADMTAGSARIISEKVEFVKVRVI